ncbi:hypothetical protein [Streptomyces sp. NPDC058701]|uniref:hypothetical protein n=1 Tax=Streptomyces sp. NPDC058701 TaxID=3346608 RepID=UPI00364E5D2D
MNMLRRVRECSDRTQADIASRAFLVASSLSNHLNGGRIPEESLLKAFYATVQGDASTHGTQLPCTLPELLELRHLARIQHCGCPTHPVSAPSSAVHGDDPPASVAVPIRTAPSRRFRRRRLTARYRALSRSPLSAVPAGSQVPVPPAEGDRHRTELSGATWTELETLTRFLAEGRNRDAGFLLWRAGKTLSTDQVIEAVASCRDAGLNEAAESLLAGVSERADRQAVLNITAAFQDAGRRTDVGFLLSVASQ